MIIREMIIMMHAVFDPVVWRGFPPLGYTTEAPEGDAVAGEGHPPSLLGCCPVLHHIVTGMDGSVHLYEGFGWSDLLSWSCHRHLTC